jgi:hypothetical protein
VQLVGINKEIEATFLTPRMEMAMESFLPEFKGLGKEIRKGRSPYAGSQRGWGLQFGDLRERILSDDLYQEALAVSLGRTIMSEMNRMNIYLLIRFYICDIAFGHIVEYGSYLGGSAIFMAYVAKKLYPGMKVFALDTYEGMPPTNKAVDMHNKGDFSNVSFDELRAYVKDLNLDNLILVKGLFEDTNGVVMAAAQHVRLAHIDCDIASAVKFAYEGVKAFMVDGGYFVFDDATVSSCIGATEVVEDFLIRRDGLNSEQIWPHFVFRNFNVSGSVP